MDPQKAWIEALGRSGLRGSDFLAQVGELGILFDGRPLCAHRQPLFLEEGKVQVYARILADFHSAVRKAKVLLLSGGLGDDSLAAKMGLTSAHRRLASIDPGHSSAATLSRVDTFCPGGHPWILELNAESPTGIGYSDALTSLMREDPLFAQVGPFGGFRSADAALRALHATFKEWGGSGAPQMAIVDFLDVPTRGDFHLLAQSFERHGEACPLVDPRDLVFEGGQLRGPLGPINLVYRRFLVEDMIRRPEDCAALLAAYEAGAACFVNSLQTSLLHSKGLFALLHSQLMKPHLSPAETKVIREHVPFTAMLKEGPLGPGDHWDSIRQSPQDWVVKPVSDSGGRGIVFGRDCDKAQWQVALGREQTVVQRVVSDWVLPFPDARNDYALQDCLVDLAPFLIRGRLAGFMCRLSQAAPVNVAQGAHLVPVFVFNPSTGVLL
jgi:uncharacterized circularly permuted ATP-grasp superfamily protein